MADTTFRLRVGVPRQVTVQNQRMDREEFYAWLWKTFDASGLLGVHEGTMLSDQAAREGFETESFTVDAAEAPRERDWIESQERESAELYFSSEAEALRAAERLSTLSGLEIGDIEKQEAQDWDAEWKASFQGVEVPPNWKILPPWKEITADEKGKIVLRVNPGAGFGTGTHETTQLCLMAIAESARRKTLSKQAVLDFGSGSGILAIGATLLGARVDGVEIDPLAIDNAVENARLNNVTIEFSRTLEGKPGPYRMVIANILKPVLLEFAETLVAHLEKGGTLILSGLVDFDVPEISVRYGALLGSQPQVYSRGEWRALAWGL